ncbi:MULTISPECIES: 4Fe-4S single cluster domain-containing protein [Pandoraea]|uniref:4Fe-4S single cluster domain-containing protein n=1 Tax=Pandoraea TaxID=93217 RepID=UPI001F5DB11A|nr:MULTISPECIES: 4Fe-4S single cluster domain-containing protein [Pandoraea]
MRLHHFIGETLAEGPGARACLWVQGCSIQCAGCSQPHTWDASLGREVSVEALASTISGITSIEGVTFLGGEPFEQAVELAELGRRLRERGLSIMTFSGYTLDKLEKMGLPGTEELLAVTDLLIDGPYVATKPDTARPWVGSTNQRFHFLTDRYRHLKDDLERIPNRIEIRIAADGLMTANGMLALDTLRQLLAARKSA